MQSKRRESAGSPGHTKEKVPTPGKVKDLGIGAGAGTGTSRRPSSALLAVSPSDLEGSHLTDKQPAPARTSTKETRMQHHLQQADRHQLHAALRSAGVSASEASTRS